MRDLTVLSTACGAIFMPGFFRCLKENHERNTHSRNIPCTALLYRNRDEITVANVATKFLPKRPIQPLVKRRVFRHHIPFDRFVSIAAVVNQLPADIRTNRHDYSGLGKKRKRVTNQI